MNTPAPGQTVILSISQLKHHPRNMRHSTLEKRQHLHDAIRAVAFGPEPERVRNHHDPQAIFEFICEYKRTHDGNSPSIREIMQACDISSTSVTNWHLKQLERRGLIGLPESYAQSRSIRVVGGQWTYQLPDGR